MHGHGLADDEAIADELADGLAGVGVGDLVHLIGVEPDLALAAADHGGGEALLGGKVDPVDGEKDEISLCTQTTFMTAGSSRLRVSGCPKQISQFSGSTVGDGTHILMSAYRRSLADDVRSTLDGKSRQ